MYYRSQGILNGLREHGFPKSRELDIDIQFAGGNIAFELDTYVQLS